MLVGPLCRISLFSTEELDRATAFFLQYTTLAGNPMPCSSHVEREILRGHHSVHRKNNLHFLACSVHVLLLSPVLNALSITGMVSATWVVDESYLDLACRKVNVREL